LRLGYQQWLEKVSSGTLAPVAVAGLVVDNTLGLQGSRLSDYQARLESRWTDRLFTVIGGERIDLTDPDFGPDFPGRKLYLNRGSASVNSIIAEQLGGFLRYIYTDAEGRGGVFDGRSVPGIPEHVAGGGVVWISPFHVKVFVSETYVGRQYVEYSSDQRFSDYWSTDLTATWETFAKRLAVSFTLGNLFDAGTPSAGRSIFGSLEYRF
jgi:hypothetical protein